MTTKKNPAAVSLGRAGGKAGTGAAKARTSEQARAAVNARWTKQQAKVDATDRAAVQRAEDALNSASLIE